MSSHHHHPAMADALRADPAEIQNVLQRSRALWGSYADAAKADSRLPEECGVLRGVLGRVPKFPGRVVETDSGPSTLRYKMWNPDLYIQGTSTWSTSSGDCNFPPKTETPLSRYAVAQPKLCILTAESSFADWPGVQGRDEDTIGGKSPCYSIPGMGLHPVRSLGRAAVIQPHRY
ncbi:MAG: hypothetical protein Q9203_004553, partial [Teloschistes exilis]